MHKCVYYSGFDPFTGWIPPSRLGALAARQELVSLAALHDVVLLPPGPLTEHAAVLPALESLRDLVAAGKITTSNDRATGTPATFLQERLTQDADQQDRCGADGEALLQMRDRLGALFSGAEWVVTRDVTTQVGGFADTALSTFTRLRTELKWTVAGAVEVAARRALDAGSKPSRDAFLAAVASTRVRVHPAETARAVALVQCEYFRNGLKHRWEVGSRDFHGFTLAPGPFFRRLPHLLAGTDTALPTVSWNTLGAVRRLAQIGIDLAQIVGLSGPDLLALIRSDAWQSLRSWALGSHLDAAEVRELAEATRVHREDVLAAVVAAGGQLAPPNLMLAPVRVVPTWRLACEAILGAGPNESMDSAVLDLASLTLRCGLTPEMELTQREAGLLALLIAAGEVGLSVRDACRAITELEQLEAGHGAFCVPGEREGLRKRTDVAKSRLAALLAPHGIRVVTDRSVWRLAGRAVTLTGRAWERLKPVTVEPPAELSPRSSAIFAALAHQAPAVIDAQGLAEVIGLKGTTAQDTAAQVSRSVHKLNAALQRTQSRWMVSGPRGIYRLLPRDGGTVASEETRR